MLCKKRWAGGHFPRITQLSPRLITNALWPISAERTLIASCLILAHRGLGKALLREKKWDQAEAEVNKALELL